MIYRDNNGGVKRLNGIDAMLLYSQTPNQTRGSRASLQDAAPASGAAEIAVTVAIVPTTTTKTAISALVVPYTAG
ncbi:Mycobacterium numidiamassiliense ORFan [Mycobacterium numidiamassiliense]|uniref:Mycobacterium numidiamassiliense ORFan n=2 Tax=Mycobacterium numidiamassiliense TaxID=1841861 RepID=A0A2U3PC03_9MYCO|nr:Mycobacterium numidiamassiliense ORFan [Mycobacterium numidiamassiliense]